MQHLHLHRGTGQIRNRVVLTTHCIEFSDFVHASNKLRNKQVKRKIRVLDVFKASFNQDDTDMSIGHKRSLSSVFELLKEQVPLKPIR
jgi:hypothetical protein